jgi:DNA-binding NarL/FixJ family response regulator
MNEPAIRVLVADDHAIVRTGIRHVLETEPGFSVVGEASNGTQALALALELRPDVAVLDISMPGVSGLQTAAELRKRLPDTRILVLSMHDNTEYVLESLRAGVHGYLLKDSAAAELGGALRWRVSSARSSAARSAGGRPARSGSSRVASGRCSSVWPGDGPTRRSRRSSGSAIAPSRATARA